MDSSSVARNLCKFLFSSDDMVIELGFVLQGESSDELPERVLAGFRCYRLSLSEAKPLSALSAPSKQPTSPSSYSVFHKHTILIMNTTHQQNPKSLLILLLRHGLHVPLSANTLAVLVQALEGSRDPLRDEISGASAHVRPELHGLRSRRRGNLQSRSTGHQSLAPRHHVAMRGLQREQRGAPRHFVGERPAERGLAGRQIVAVRVLVVAVLAHEQEAIARQDRLVEVQLDGHVHGDFFEVRDRKSVV